MTTTRTHPAPTKPDFHCALLWLRSLEIHTGRSLELDNYEMRELFISYHSPWKA